MVISTKLSCFIWWPQQMFWHYSTLVYLRVFITIWRASKVLQWGAGRMRTFQPRGFPAASSWVWGSGGTQGSAANAPGLPHYPLAMMLGLRHEDTQAGAHPPAQRDWAGWPPAPLDLKLGHSELSTGCYSLSPQKPWVRQADLLYFRAVTGRKLEMNLATKFKLS